VSIIFNTVTKRLMGEPQIASVTHHAADWRLVATHKNPHSDNWQDRKNTGRAISISLKGVPRASGQPRYANQLPGQVESLIVSLKRDKPHWARARSAGSWSGAWLAMRGRPRSAPSMPSSIAMGW